jgi:hypothetical protein
MKEVPKRVLDQAGTSVQEIVEDIRTVQRERV